MRQFSISLVLGFAALSLTGCPDINSGNHSGLAPSSYDTATPSTDAGTVRVKPADAGPVDAGPVDAGKTADGSVTTKDAGPISPSLSCKGKCDAKYNSTLKCQCNADCAKFHNCCADYGPLCKPELLSCAGRCGTATKGDLCQCDWSCGHYGSCCADYLGKCEPNTELDMPLADAEETLFCNKPANVHNVKYTKDGDTIELINGDTIRYLVVNTPELSKKDCYAQEAFHWTKAMVKQVKSVCLIMDPSEGDKDQYGRLLRYVLYKDPAANGKWVNMNLRLVRLGFGPVFYPYATGQKWEKMGVLMQEKARETKTGGWGACGWN